VRQLRPDVVENRKKRLLQWVIHRYIKTSAPVASQTVSEAGGMDLSSATIRNVLKELEEGGYLEQPHTSAGRVPTDKGYRFYVDYLMDVQRLAAEEKARIESQYASRTEELDHLLSETSKLLSHASHSAGLVLSPKMEKQVLKRLELVPMGGKQILAVVVTQAGLIRHWPIKLSVMPTAAQINRLNRFLNEHMKSKSISEVRAAVQEKMERAERELRDLGGLAKQLLDEVAWVEEPGELYMEGTTRILAHPEDLGGMDDIQSLIQVIEGKKMLARVLERELEEHSKAPSAKTGKKSAVRVRIGKENALPALRNMSLITTAYTLGDQVVGVLGILGAKRMEYSRMMGLVDLVSRQVSETLRSWDSER